MVALHEVGHNKFLQSFTAKKKKKKKKKKPKWCVNQCTNRSAPKMKFQMSFEVYETPRENTIYFISNSSNCLVTDFSGAHKAPSPTLSVNISRFSRSA
ncbi:hypothetical protein VN97_g4439 [Penicillium thymicola]|uniref:Uncharacterized protein n=1 Tax=Penicillium thymicola TaxID=293382 RepID=A0AAI9TK96_PENTH|nr:hypothetical protein VN97_g4439 [Penicillium thymicola]